MESFPYFFIQNYNASTKLLVCPKNMSRIVINKKFTIPLLLLLVCILSFGILIPTLGLYWDGWPYMWQYHVFGPGGFPQFVASDRPYSAWIFMLTTSLFGTKVIWYHLAVFMFRWLSACLVWWMLNLLWEEKWLTNGIIALFFLVYPGFLQQPISLPYVHHISHLALFFFSMWGTLFSLRDPKKYRWLTFLCVLSSIIVNFSLEYYAPLEILRPIFIFIYLKEKSQHTNDSIKRTLITWLPYFAGLLFFLGWRILIFKFPTYSPKLLDQFSSSAESSTSIILTDLFKSIYTVSITAWGKVFHFPTIGEFGTAATYLFFILISVSTIILFTVLFLLSRKTEKPITALKKMKCGYPFLLLSIGFLSIFLPASMYWVLKLPILVEFAWDRLNLSFILGVSMFMGGLVALMGRRTWVNLMIVAILASLSIGFHFQNGMSYKRDWDSFKDFFWQLTWRAPDLKKGTIILTTEFPLRYYSDNSLTAPLNWTYDPQNKSSQLNYLFYFTDVRLKSGRLSSLSDNLPIEQPFRSFSFVGNTSQSLILKYSPPGCLQLLDTLYANSGIIPNLSQLESNGIPLSKLSLIELEPYMEKHPPVDLFGNEPSHDWCYFFEKADLARQKSDWQKIIQLKNQASQNGLEPRNPSEWLPFIEAFMRTGDFSTAKLLIDSSIKDERYLSGICYTWKRMQNDPLTKATTLAYIQRWEGDYNCDN